MIKFLKKTCFFGHLCKVPAKQHQHLLLFLPHRCPKIGENCSQSSENSVQMGPKITAATVGSSDKKGVEEDKKCNMI